MTKNDDDDDEDDDYDYDYYDEDDDGGDDDYLDNDSDGDFSVSAMGREPHPTISDGGFSLRLGRVVGWNVG